MSFKYKLNKKQRVRYGKHFKKILKTLKIIIVLSGYFHYPVSGRIYGLPNPVSDRIPDIKKGLIIRPVHPYYFILWNSQQQNLSVLTRNLKN
jgi:hypothetical protein